MKIKDAKSGVRRKVITLVLISIVLISGYYLAISLTKERRTAVIVRGSYKHIGELGYEAELKPNRIYGKRTIGSGDTVYSSLLSNMTLIYSYKLENADNVTGTYRIAVVEGSFSRERWEKEYYVKSGSFEGEMNARIPVNWTEVLALWKGIEKETRYDFGEPTLRVIVSVNAKGVAEGIAGNEFESKFNHTAEIAYGRTLKFSNADKRESGKVISREVVDPKVKLMSFYIPADNAKTAFSAIFVLSLLGAVISSNVLSRVKAARRNGKKNETGIKVSGIHNFLRVVEVPDAKGIEKLSYELDRPVLSLENKLVVLDGDTAYICESRCESG